MSVISNSLRNLSAFLENHQVSFSNGLLILFTIGGEHIFRFNAFKCPCNHDEAFIYALIFMLVPAVVLGIIGVVVSNLTWRIFHGCRSRAKTATNGYTKTFGYVIIVIARASVVPFAWLFIALLDGNYYACMRAMKPCENDTEEILHLKSMSQNIAWLSLGSLIVVSFIVICCVRCCDSVTYLQYKYLHFYREAEQDLMDKHMQEFTKNSAEENVEEFLKRAKKTLKKKDFDDLSEARNGLDKNDWDKVSRIPDHCLSNKDDNLIVFLSPLEEWMHQNPTQAKDPTPQPEVQRVETSQQENVPTVVIG